MKFKSKVFTLERTESRQKGGKYCKQLLFDTTCTSTCPLGNPRYIKWLRTRVFKFIYEFIKIPTLNTTIYYKCNS